MTSFTTKPTRKTDRFWPKRKSLGEGEADVFDPSRCRCSVRPDNGIKRHIPRRTVCSPSDNLMLCIWEKHPCQQQNEGENDALTPARCARNYRVLRNHGCR